MQDICNKCGLPKDLCVCESISKEAQKITIEVERKRFRKYMTIIKGINPSEIDIPELEEISAVESSAIGTLLEKEILFCPVAK